jgi:ABC-type multidrug transport system fused ATPase/permease subunit
METVVNQIGWRRTMNRQLNPLTPESTLFETFLIKREQSITVLVTLCGVLAILLGVGWCLVKRDLLLYPYAALYLSYLMGQKYWKFRDRNHAEREEKASCNKLSMEGVDR